MSEEYEEDEEKSGKEDVYKEEEDIDLVEDDEMTPEEGGFMAGYESADESESSKEEPEIE